MARSDQASISVEYDPADLRTVQYLRAAIDPIPVYPRGQQLAASSGPGLSQESVRKARFEQVENQESPAPLDVVPWEEAMLCMRSTFNDPRFATTPAWVGAIKYAFQRFLSTRGMEPEEVLPTVFVDGPPVPETVDPDSMSPHGGDAVIQRPDVESVSQLGETEYHREVAETFRRDLKLARDRIFLAAYYEDLLEAHPADLDVPKLVWWEAKLANDRADEPTPNHSEATADIDTDNRSEVTQVGLDAF